jgi:hypothetical protein
MENIMEWTELEINEKVKRAAEEKKLRKPTIVNLYLMKTTDDWLISYTVYMLQSLLFGGGKLTNFAGLGGFNPPSPIGRTAT